MRAIEWGSGAEWFGAIATTAAVVIALFQRRWDERERITFRVNLSKEKLSIHLFNPTNHPVVIQHCTLELGRWRRSDFDDEGIDLLLGFIGMPMNLKAHEDTTFTVAAPYVDVSYLPGRLRKARLQRSRFNRQVFVVVTTGTGKRIRHQVSKPLVNEMVERAPS